MEGKQLDLDAPLLSARRFAYSIPSSPLKGRIVPSSEAGKRINESPGRIPFLWEQSPGRRKDKDEPTIFPLFVPRKTTTLTKDTEEEDDDFFTNAESCRMSCSTSGLPEANPNLTNYRLREFVMGRFLPAAHAIASISPQRRTSPRTFSGGENEILVSEGSPTWRRGTKNGEEEDAVLLHPCEKVVCVDSVHVTGATVNNEGEAVDSDNQELGSEARERIIPLPPPLPASPSDSWLLRTLPTIEAKGMSGMPFLRIQPGRMKQPVSPTSRSSRLGKLGLERASVISSIDG